MTDYQVMLQLHELFKHYKVTEYFTIVIGEFEDFVEYEETGEIVLFINNGTIPFNDFDCLMAIISYYK